MSAGALLFVGLGGTALGAEERALLRRVRPGGVVLLPRNIDGAEELLALTAELRAELPEALLCVDAEGGRVDRLRGLVGSAPAAADLARAPVTAARRAGRWIGESLRRFDFDLDFAPVVDLDHGRVDNALDRRCLGREPRGVTARGRAFALGLHAAGVGSCVKHFPGLGAAGEDTHRLGAEIGGTRVERERDLAPFRRLAAVADSLMVAHASYAVWDAEHRPATLSPPITTGLVRARLRFAGTVFSDDLEMGALAPWGDLAARTSAALAAGCDGLLVCHSLATTPEIAARLGAAPYADRVEEAQRRLAALRARIERRRRGLPPPRPLGEIRRRLAALRDRCGA